MASLSASKRSARVRSRAPGSRKDLEERRAQITAETIRLVGERGFYGFSLQELADRCQITGAGLLYHFGSKEQLLGDVLKQFERSESERMAPFAALALKQGKASVVGLRQLLRAMFARVSSNNELCRFYIALQSEALDRAHPAHAFLAARDAKTIDLLTKLVTPLMQNPTAIARYILALMDGLLQQWLREKRAFDVLDAWDNAMDIVLPECSSAKRPRRGP
jgi:AcrR family transcriptional regulator